MHSSTISLRAVRSLVIAGAAAALAVTVTVRVDGQAAKAPAPAASKRAIPRLADGHPDLQGIYDLATLTPVERPAGSPLVMSDEEACKLERQAAARRDQLGAPIDGNRAAPPVGGDGSAGAGRQRRRLQQFLDRRRVALYGHRRAAPRVAPHRSAGRPRAADDAAGAAAVRAQHPADVGSVGARGRSGIRGRRRLRRSRAPSAWRALPHGLRLDVRAAGRCRTTSTTTSIRSCRRRILC